MPLVFGVVCEARADLETSCALADRVLCAEVDWISAEGLDDYRKWQGADQASPCLLWREVPARARALGLRAHGHFKNEPAEEDARAVRRVLRIFKAIEPPLDAILLLRDDDRQVQRRRGFEQARKEVDLGIPIVIGLAHTKRECWVLAGFDPCDDNERARLDELRQELGFDPRTHAHELTAKHDKRSAKRVLHYLTGKDPDRERACWLQGALNVFEDRGQNTGLNDYLSEVRERLVPLFKSVPTPSVAQGGK